MLHACVGLPMCFFEKDREMPLLALIEIMLLWLCIAYMAKSFYKYEKWAAYLLIPYLLWVGFAANLNFSIWLPDANLRPL